VATGTGTLLVQGTTSRAGATWIATGLRRLLAGVTVIDGNARDDGRLDADGPALLVADIDRGGSFASIAGTMMLLGPADRARVIGFVLNRFRGDPALLDAGLKILRDRFGVPTLGVVPFVRELSGPADAPANPTARLGAGLRAGIVRRADVTSYVALAWLEAEAGASVAWVERPADLERLDLALLPDGPSDSPATLRLDHPEMVLGLRRLLAGGRTLVLIGSARAAAEGVGLAGPGLVLAPSDGRSVRACLEACLSGLRAARGLPSPAGAERTSGEDRPGRIADVLRASLDLGPLRAVSSGALA
jgi:hypothetical protein